MWRKIRRDIDKWKVMKIEQGCHRAVAAPSVKESPGLYRVRWKTSLESPYVYSKGGCFRTENMDEKQI